MGRIIKIGFIYILFFIYIFHVVFKAVPVSSKFFIYGLGVLYAFPKIVSGKYKLKKEYKSILSLCLIVLLWDIVVCVLNWQFEMYLTNAIISIVLSIFGAHMVYDFSKSYIQTKDKFLQVILYTIGFHSLYALAMKFIPQLYSLADSIQVFLIPKDTVGDDIVAMQRFIGLGTASYFGALLPCALALMTATYLITTTKSTIKLIVYIVIYLLTAVFTFFTARTSILLVALSLFFLLLYQRRISFAKIFKMFFYLAILVSFAYVLIIQFIDINTITWALDVFNEKDSGSGGLVKEWWLNTKFPLKTLLIGDGRYSDGELLYYKRIDIGVHRKIFYGGLMGIALELLLHWKTLRYMSHFDHSRGIKLLSISLFISYVVIICKGDISMMSLFILYLVFYSEGVFERKNISRETATVL